MPNAALPASWLPSGRNNGRGARLFSARPHHSQSETLEMECGPPSARGGVRKRAANTYRSTRNGFNFASGCASFWLRAGRASRWARRRSRPPPVRAQQRLRASGATVRAFQPGARGAAWPLPHGTKQHGAPRCRAPFFAPGGAHRSSLFQCPRAPRAPPAPRARPATPRRAPGRARPDHGEPRAEFERRGVPTPKSGSAASSRRQGSAPSPRPRIAFGALESRQRSALTVPRCLDLRHLCDCRRCEGHATVRRGAPACPPHVWNSSPRAA